MNRGGGRVRTKLWKANGKTNELFLLSGSGLIRTTLPFRLISFLSGGENIIEGQRPGPDRHTLQLQEERGGDGLIGTVIEQAKGGCAGRGC